MSSLGMSIYSLSVAAIVTGVLSVLDAGESSGTGKFVRFAISAALLAALLAPVSSLKNMLFGGGTDEIKAASEQIRAYIEEKAETSRESILKESIAEAEERISALTAERFGVGAEDVSAELVCTGEEGETEVSSVTVYLGLRAYLLDPGEVEDYVTEICGCACRVKFR